MSVHRELIRNLQQWRSLYEALEVPDVLVATDGRSYSLWDVEVFYSQRVVLADRQQESIRYCLFENMKEQDAAVRMGIAKTNPVSVYATIGLTLLLDRALCGDLSGYTLALDDRPEAPLLSETRFIHNRYTTPTLYGIEA